MLIIRKCHLVLSFEGGLGENNVCDSVLNPNLPLELIYKQSCGIDSNDAAAEEMVSDLILTL